MLSAFWQQWQHGWFLFSFPARKKSARLYPIPWEGAALGGICPSCGVFAEGHSFLFRKSWCAGCAVSCGDGRGACVEEKYASFHGGRYGMLHGADKGFVESGKYGKPGKYFLGFLNLFLWNLFICTPAMICFIIIGKASHKYFESLKYSKKHENSNEQGDKSNVRFNG